MNARHLCLLSLLAVPALAAAKPADDGERILREAITRAKPSGKLIFLWFGAEWCPYAHTFRYLLAGRDIEIDESVPVRRDFVRHAWHEERVGGEIRWWLRGYRVREVGAKPRLPEVLRKHYVVAHVPMVPTGSRDKHGGDFTINEALRRRYRVTSSPTAVVLRADGTMVERVPLRFLDSGRPFIPSLEAISSERLADRLLDVVRGVGDGSKEAAEQWHAAMQRAASEKKLALIFFHAEWDLDSALLQRALRGLAVAPWGKADQLEYRATPDGPQRVWGGGESIGLKLKPNHKQAIEERAVVAVIPVVPPDSRDRYQGTATVALAALNDAGARGLPHVVIFGPDGTFVEAWHGDLDTRVGAGVFYKPAGRGYVVQSVVKGGPAEAAGLAPGDEILEIGGRSVAGLDENAMAALFAGGEGHRLEFLLRRGGAQQKRTVIKRLIDFKAARGEYALQRLQRRRSDGLPIYDLPRIVERLNALARP